MKRLVSIVVIVIAECCSGGGSSYNHLDLYYRDHGDGYDC